MRRTIVVAAVLLTSAAMLLAQSQSVPTPPPQPKVEVRLVLNKPVIRPGEPLEVTALIKNVGDEAFYVRQGLVFAYYGEGVLILKLTDKGGKEVSEKYKFGGHAYKAGQEDFAEHVEKNWLLLHPGQFYGLTDVRFEGIQLTPGSYCLEVSYRNNIFPWVFDGKTPAEVQESAKKLQHPPLLGDFKSNVVSFTVVK